MADPTTNPPIYEGTPADGDIVQYRASDNSWQLVTVAAAGAITVPGTHIAQIATANATDLASAEALANALKVSVNTLLTELQTAGILAAS